MYKAIDVYLERTSARQYVGRLSKIRGRFVFEYNETYRYSDNAVPFGPDLPINKRKHLSLKLFPSFADRIPSRENPAYKEYCQSVGISPSEKNPFVLLVKLGRKGPSSFILAPVSEESDFSREDLKHFRKKLNLSIREFAELFDVSSATIYRIENNKSSGKNILKRIKIYFNSPEKALAKIEHTGHKINDQKRSFVQNFLKSKFQEKFIGYSPFTVKAEDIQKCSSQQAVELLRRLMLLECSHCGIPRNSIHISSSVSVKDGGQDGLAAEWEQGPVQTNYFPSRYNCFQVKASSLSPSKIIKEISEKQNPKKLNKALQYVIKNKGAYILCSTHGVAGVKIQDIESAIKKEIQAKADNLNTMQVKFYDGNRLADWLNCYPSVVVWFLNEVCGRSIRPWSSWLEWSQEDLDYRSEFMSHPELDKKRRNIRSILSRPGGAIHLMGASGLGKTRLVLEAFRPVSQKPGYFGEMEEDLSDLILYSPAEELKAFSFKELSSRAILIIDDCSIKQAESFHKVLSTQKASGLSLLTIGNGESVRGMFRTIWKEKNEAEKQIIKLEPDEKIVKKILLGSQNIINKHIEPKYRELTSGFPLMAKLLKEAGPVDLLQEDIPTIRNKMLWGQQEPDKEGKRVIRACSLFDTICFSNEGQEMILDYSINRWEKEAKYIAEAICKIDYNIFYEKIQYFKKRKIIQQHGRFIQVRPKPLAVWLAKDLIENTLPESRTKWFTDMDAYKETYKLDPMEKNLYSKTERRDFIRWRTEQSAINGLRESFCKQLSYLASFSDAQILAEHLCGEGGFFGSEERLNTEWGFRCFRHLAELNFTVALKTLQRVFGNKNQEGLQNVSAWKNSIILGKVQFPSELIWTLEQMAFIKELYPQSARLLLKFAEAEENDNWGPTATDVFTEHFQLYLSGTEATPNLKFQIIDEIKKSSSIKQKEIAIKALNKALKTAPWIGRSSISDIMQTKSGKTYKAWRPKTDEQGDYFRTALKYLVWFATKDEHQGIQNKALKIISDNLNSLLREGLYNDMEKAVKEIGSIHGSHQPSMIHTLLKFLKYNSKKIKSEHIKQVQKMLDILHSQEDINGRIKTYITECSWSYIYADKKENPEYKERFQTLLKDFIEHLLNENKDKIESSLQILFHGEQRNTLYFARKIAESLKDPLRFAFEFLNFIKNSRENKDFNPSFLAGFVVGLNSIDPSKKEKLLDEIAKDSNLVDFLIPAYYNISLQDQDIKRLINVIDKINLKSADLRTLAIGQTCKSVSLETMGKLIQVLSRKGIRFSWDALQIYNYYECRNKSEQKNKLFPILYDLLTQDRFLSDISDKENFDTMDDYEKAVNDLLDSDYGVNFSKKFISQIIAVKTSLIEFPISEETIRKCLSKIIGKYPDIILPMITNNINNCNIDFLFKTKSGNRHQKTSPLARLSPEQIKGWCETDPDKIPAFLAKNRPLLSGQSWSPFARFLLDEYGHKAKVTEALSMNLDTFSWAGNLSDYFEQTKKLVEPLIGHKHKNVRDFAESEISHLDKMIQNQRRREKELEEFGIW